MDVFINDWSDGSDVGKYIVDHFVSGVVKSVQDKWVAVVQLCLAADPTVVPVDEKDPATWLSACFGEQFLTSAASRILDAVLVGKALRLMSILPSFPTLAEEHTFDKRIGPQTWYS